MFSMLPETHLGFTEQLLKATNSEHMYVVWANVPDVDMFNFHRYTYHQINSFNKLFFLYGDKQQCKKTIALTLLGHIYLDCLAGPVKCLNGLNFTCNPLFFNGLNDDYIQGIEKVCSIIHNDKPQFQDKICDIFKGFEYSNKETYIAVLTARLIEMTIGRLNIEKEINYLHTFLGSSVYKNVTDVEYRKTYNNFINLEMQVNQAIINL